ncbi:hypothetical protein [Candidatus Palauibacter sp.]|uniref:hypothetical protein n=1 Tax=Candidatus Palauibacter sp. TaxID=3101350 RepID=UPI003C704B0D
MDWTLSDGTTLRELVQSEPIVVVVVDPSQCLLCSSVLAEWLYRERMSGVNVELLLAREPENHERRILLAAGVRADGYLRGVQIEPQRTPIELVVDSGGVLFRAERVYGPSSPLLDALEDGRSLREAVDALSVLEHEAKSTTEGDGVAWNAELQSPNTRSG